MGVPASTRRILGPSLRRAVLITAAIDIVIGLVFLVGPELGFDLWPTPVPPLLSRFIGSIVLANGVGAIVVARQGTWEGARALFAVALVYGVGVFVAVLYHLLAKDADPVFWWYVVVDGLFLGPIGYVFWRYDQDMAGEPAEIMPEPRMSSGL